MVEIKTKFLIFLLLIVGILFISGINGCGEKECESNADCLEKDCFTAKCAESKCVYSPIEDCCGNEICEVGEKYPECAADCPNCDDKNNCTVDEYDYHKKECVNTLILDKVCCGNTLCERGESYETCFRDCPDCDDENECTKDLFDYYKQECINEPIIPCCGNEICDKDAETYSTCSADCPSCNDNNKLTEDSFNYETQLCENLVTHYFIDDFEEGTGNWAFSGEGSGNTIKENGNTVLKLNGVVQANLKNEWGDYIFKFRFKRIEGSMHANFRHSFTEEGWNRYLIGVSERGVDMLSKQIGSDFQKLKEIDFKLDKDWHTLEIRSYDNVINVYVDDEFAIKYMDPENPFFSGSVGVEIHTGGAQVTPEFLIDDVEIKVLSEEEMVFP